MNATKQVGHTPGPWCVVQHDHADGDLWLSVNQEVEINGIKAGAEWVAEVKYLTTDEERQWANARLIAAAPEMLEALRDLHAAISDYMTSDPDMPSHSQAESVLEDRMELAFVAIAKAEGRREAM